MADLSIDTYAIYDDQGRDVRFSGPWIHYTLTGTENEDIYNWTLTSAPSTSCSLTFKFNATVLGVFGTILPANGTKRPISSYSVDGASPSTFIPAENITERQDNQLFFVSDALATGQHTLSITVTQVDDNDPFLMDYILVATASDTDTAKSPSVTYVTTTIQGLPTNTAQTLIESSSGTPTGAIVGGVVGGVAMLVAAALMVYFCWYRRRRAGVYYYHHADDLDHDSKPFVITPYAPPENASYDPSIRNSFASVDTAVQPHRQSVSVGYQDTSSSSVSGSRPPTKAQLAGIHSVPLQTTYHTDAGVRFNLAGPSGQQRQGPAEAPPLYTES